MRNNCADIYVDVNGLKPPNIFGKDTFLFAITRYGVLPRGNYDDHGMTTVNRDPLCGYNNYGMGCAAWVLQKGNLNYPATQTY